jgi:hypothetical protein
MRKFTFWILPLLTTPMATAALASPDAIAIGVINDLSGCPAHSSQTKRSLFYSSPTGI